MTYQSTDGNGMQDLRAYSAEIAMGLKKTGYVSGRAAAKGMRRGLSTIKDTDRRYSDSGGKNEVQPREIEWLQDNWYLAEKLGGLAIKEFSEAERLPAADAERALITAAAEAYVRYENGAVSEKTMLAYLDAFQSETVLCERELCLFAPALVAALIGYIADICRNMRADGGAVGDMGNAFTSLRFLDTFDASEVIKKANRVERILAADPAGVYATMDDDTRHAYRKAVTRLAEKSGKSEYETATEVVREAQSKNAHIGAILNGKIGFFGGRRRAFSDYAFSICAVSLLAAVAAAVALKSVFAGVLLLLPISEAVKNTADFIILKTVKPRRLPRVELREGIPNEGRTVCVISVLLSTPESAVNAAQLLEKYRLLNRDAGKNLLFGLLADLPEAKTETAEGDGAVTEAAKRSVAELNEKYGGGFYLFMRKRIFSEPHGCYMGWERKRGAVYGLAMLLGGRQGELQCECGDISALNGSKFILTLDGDTRLSAGAASELVSAALHPLNRAVVDKRKRIVKSGYGILQPRVAVELNAANRSDFTRIFAGQGGVDPYGSVASDVYQDLFGEGSFNGKGLIDVEAYCACMPGRLPENAVLSHDLLEGAYLRCGYISDVEIADGYPYKLLSYYSRQHRWVRGDWQISPWLFGTVRTASGAVETNQLSGLNRWKIFDNLRRSLVPVFTFAGIMAGFLAPGLLWCSAIAAMSVLSKLLISSLELVFRRDNGAKAKYYSTIISGFGGWLMQAVLMLILLPYEAWINLSATATALYRVIVSRKNMLRWTTAAEAEKRLRGGVLQSFARMWSCVAAGASLVLFTRYPWAAAVGVIWIFTPACASALSREIVDKRHIGAENEAYLLENGRAIWGYFKDFLTREDNFLPPDNWQEAPATGAAHRTSPTNIGLALLSIFAARDLGYISDGEAADTTEKMIYTIERMKKWNGHLYNWYDTRTLDTLKPEYISTVDSGNLVCAMITAARALDGLGRHDLSARLQAIADGMDFKPLFDDKKKLFYIGRSMADERPTEGWYDLMASEARLTSYYAVASGQVTRKHWRKLSRTLVSQDNYSGMVSWTGTMFEYLMPNLLLPCCKNSLLYESSKFCVHAQKKRAVGRVWGISESGFYAFDTSLGYKYKAHGVQRLALKRKMDTEAVISPYSAYLALSVDFAAAVRDLRAMDRLGARGKYGHFEAIDFSPSRQTGGKYKLVMSYMAHHLGMSLVSIDNLLRGNIMQRRFMENTEMAAFEELLQEKIPLGVMVLRRSPRDVPEKPVRSQADGWRMELDGADIYDPRCALLSNGSYSVMFSETGATESSLGGLDITRSDGELFGRYCGASFYLRCGGRTYCLTPAPEFDVDCAYSSVLSGDECAIRAEFSDFVTNTSVSVPRDENGEIRTVTVEYAGDKGADCELMCFFEPVMQKRRDYEAHRAFSRLQLEFTTDGDSVSVRRRGRGSSPERYLCMKCSRESSFRISETEVFGRGDTIITEDFPARKFENAAAYDACVFAVTPFHIEPGGRIRVKYSIAAALNRQDAATAAERMQRGARSESASVLDLTAAELGMTHGEITEAFSLLTELKYMTGGADMGGRRTDRAYSRGDLWKFGISGDYTIAAVRIDTEKDAESAGDALKKYAFLTRGGYIFDLVFVLSDGADYRSPLYRAVFDIVRSFGLEGDVGARGGIHFADSEKESCDAIFALADAVLTIGAESGYVRRVGEPFTLKRGVRSRGEALPETRFMHGQFSFACDSRLPAKAWSNILTNGRFGFIATDAGTGHMWLDNAREERVNRWLNDSRTDTGTETLELIKDGERISLFAAEDGHKTYVSYTPGAARWRREIDGAVFSVCAFVPRDINARVFIIDVKNAPQNCRIAYFTDLVLASEGRDQKSVMVCEREGVIRAINAAGECRAVFSLSSSERARAWTADKTEWARGELRGKAGTGICACAAAVYDVRDRLVIVCGFLTEAEMAYLCVEKNAESELETAEKYWLERCSPIIIETPEPALDNYINSWALYQTEACRIDGRSSIYQSGGAYGFRDQLQDACALIWTDPKKAKELIVNAAKHQYEEGDVQHWWHEKGEDLPDKGVRTRCSDDLLWLPYALCRYIEMTGDKEAAKTECGFLRSRTLDDTEADRYEQAQPSDMTATLFEHARLAVNLVLKRGTGKHGLCLFGGGDWNDGMNTVGINGRGESVWLTWFLSGVLKKMASLCERLGLYDESESYLRDAERLSGAAEEAWDGKWYLRGYYDSGEALGSEDSGECKIDSVAQSFAVVGGGKRAKDAVLAAFCELYDEKSGITSLLKPPFESDKSGAGYISGYAPGLRENGGQYSHAAVWLSRALFDIGESEKGWAVLRDMLPARRDISEYRAEPFVLAADVYTARGLEGCGGWSWYTGTAGWYYRTALESMLGIRLVDGRLEIRPNLPESWSGYKAKLRFFGENTLLTVTKEGEKYRILLNGREYESDGEAVDNKSLSKY
ncbi:MAG: hypothetical protein IKI49_02470 [Oscillospiraceae bacterium]|nr:hypothetical protein [Oscillospiraceae bacterium]